MTPGDERLHDNGAGGSSTQLPAPDRYGGPRPHPLVGEGRFRQQAESAVTRGRVIRPPSKGLDMRGA